MSDMGQGEDQHEGSIPSSPSRENEAARNGDVATTKRMTSVASTYFEQKINIPDADNVTTLRKLILCLK